MPSYPEGLLIGYRGYDARRHRRYPFGPGLGYTTRDYDPVDGPASPSEGTDLELTV